MRTASGTEMVGIAMTASGGGDGELKRVKSCQDSRREREMMMMDSSSLIHVGCNFEGQCILCSNRYQAHMHILNLVHPSHIQWQPSILQKTHIVRDTRTVCAYSRTVQACMLTLAMSTVALARL
jgi:hypothetical protein